MAHDSFMNHLGVSVGLKSHVFNVVRSRPVSWIHSINIIVDDFSILRLVIVPVCELALIKVLFMGNLFSSTINVVNDLVRLL
jgi:hypothetical protein